MGNQLCSARVMFGYAPASPAPNRNRTTINTARGVIVSQPAWKAPI